MLFNKKRVAPKAKDFTRSDLPSSRRKQFFLFFRYEWKLMLILPFFFLLLFAPYLGITILEQVYSVNNPDKNLFTFALMSEGIKAICIILPFLSFGGLNEIHRHLSLNEGVLFWKDYLKGFNLKWLLFGLMFGICNVLLVLLSSIAGAFNYAGVFYYLVLGLFCLVIYPIMCFACIQSTYYTLDLKGYLSNGVKFTIKYYPYMFLFSLYPLAPRLLGLIPNMPIFIYDTIIVIFMALSPIYALLLYSFCLDKFDENINKDNHPFFYRKGLSEKITKGEQDNESTSN